MKIRKREGALPPNSLHASMQIHNMRDLVRATTVNRRGDADAWRYYEVIGEVHFGLSSGAREASRAALKAVRWSGHKSHKDARGLPRDLVAALRSKNGGQPNLISSFYLNRKITGDGFLLGYQEGDDDWFDFCSTSEILRPDQGAALDGNVAMIKRKKSRLATNDQNGEEEHKLSDIILSRIWTPHPQYSDDADSPLKALSVICDELDLLTRSLKAKITSRLAMAGILYIASNLQIAVPDRPSDAPDRISEDPLVDYLHRLMMQAILSPDEPSAVIPIILRGPQGDLDQMISWITMEREVFKTDIEQRNELIRRVLAGLDLRPEQVEGFSDSNHWSAWSTQDVHLKVDVAPDLEALCWALTTDYLWPQLRQAVEDGDISANLWTESEIRKHTVWYDMAALTVRPNQADSFQELWDRMEVSGDALRDATGATKEQAPDEAEQVRIFGKRYGYPRMAFYGTKVIDDLDDDMIVKVPAKPGPDAGPGGDGPVGPGKGDDRGSPGRGDSDKPKSERPDS